MQRESERENHRSYSLTHPWNQAQLKQQQPQRPDHQDSVDGDVDGIQKR